MIYLSDLCIVGGVIQFNIIKEGHSKIKTHPVHLQVSTPVTPFEMVILTTKAISDALKEIQCSD